MDFFKRFGEFFQEDNGGYSAIRLGYLSALGCALAMFVMSCLYAHALVPIDDSILKLIAVCGGLKMIQKFGEQKDAPTTTDSTTTKP